MLAWVVPSPRAKTAANPQIGLYLTRVVDATTLGLDLVITGGMTFVLFRSRTGWSETDKLVNRLILYVTLAAPRRTRKACARFEARS